MDFLNSRWVEMMGFLALGTQDVDFWFKCYSGIVEFHCIPFCPELLFI